MLLNERDAYMKKVVFLYSGEGTKSSQSSLKIVKTSPRWAEITEILKSRLAIDLEEIWKGTRTNTAAPIAR